MAFDGTQMVPDGADLGPYCSVYGDRLINYNGELGRFRIGLYGAYNVMGLIGKEHCGIYILDQKKMHVFADRMPIGLEKSRGWYGGEKPTFKELRALEQVASMSSETFHTWVNQSPDRIRYEIEPPIRGV